MFAAATVFAYGCSDNFDDSALWKDIDGMYKSLNELKAQVTTMQQQLDALAAVVSGGAVTSITQDADGHFKFIVSEGIIEDGPTLQNGDTTFRTRFSIGAREWNNRWCECGPTHHFAAAQGSWTGTILKVAEILNVPVEVVC